MSHPEDLLSISGAVLEIDSVGDYFLKIRSFPKVRPELTNKSWDTFTDVFVHNKNSELRRGDEYIRRRLDHSTMTEEIVKQTDSIDITPFAHCYREEKLTKLPDDVEIYVSYSFQRWYLELATESSHASLYVDKVTEPVEYTIETLRIKLNFDPTCDHFIQRLENTINQWCEYTKLPVYTKLMLVLQCSAQFELYDELYCQFDPSRELVPRKIEMILDDPALIQTNREYIWFVNNQIRRTQLMFDMGFSEADCYNRLKTLKPTGDHQSFERYTEDE